MEVSNLPTEPEVPKVPASAVAVSGTGVSTAVKEAREADQDVARALDLSGATPEDKPEDIIHGHPPRGGISRPIYL